MRFLRGGVEVSALLPHALGVALRIDDEVAESLYSPRRMVTTYTKSQNTQLKNNYKIGRAHV